MTRDWLALTVILVLSGPLAAAEFGVLYPAPGAEEVYNTCAACHSEMLVAQQGLTRKGWDDVLAWMTEEMGMGELPPELTNTILDYLAVHYGPDRPHFPR